MELREKAFYDINIAPGQRACLMGPYDIEIRLPGEITIEVGRFSLGAVERVRVLSSKPGRLLRIGALCEIATGAAVLVGGEHRNDSLFNYTYGAAGLAFRVFMTAEASALAGAMPPAPIVIGNNVTISANATVHSGITVGDGVVIGAGAVVRSDCEPYGIYAGIPARRLRDRFSGEMAETYRALRLADVMAHQMAELPSLVDLVERQEISLADYLARISFLPPARPTLYLDASFGPDGRVQINNKPAGYALGDQRIEGPQVEQLDAYFAQIRGTDTVRWTPDIFQTLGLY